MEAKLTPFQAEVLESFFRHESRFFLTGGAALAGFHLGHRSTQDLDLFSTGDVLDSGSEALRQVARELRVDMENLRTSPTFRRFLLRRGSERLVVDLVQDPVPQGDPEKLRFGSILVDTPAEILANKLCALLSRAELRDLVDVMALERAGHSLDRALALAMRKDGGLTAAQLAWVLGQLRIGADARIPGGIDATSLTRYLEDLRRRLVDRAHPG